MKRIKSLLAAALVALLSAAFILPITACNNDDGADGNNVVYVTSMGGMALKNVSVELFNGDSRITAKATDDEGKVTYNLKSNTEYKVKVSDLPAGFLPEESYTVKGSDETTYVRIDSKIIAEGTPKNYYSTGDVLYDFEQTYYTFNSTTNKMETRTAKLSDFFAEGKKAVLINFNFNGCGACDAEYPYLSAAYQKYSDKLEVIGINDYGATSSGSWDETEKGVQQKVQLEKVPYLMCKDKASVGIWFQSFVDGLYPTSIMIDRYGILCETLQGSSTSQSFWDDWFEKYTSDNYSQDITQGEDPGELFVPDVPGDFNVSMPDSSALNRNTKINNTGRNIIFSAYANNSSYGWPWDYTEDQSAIYPTNSGHKGTMAVIYAQIDLKANEVLAFDYKLSTLHENDYFYVSLDSRGGTGRQISMTSGVQDWQTGYSYAALEDGRHEIEFSYYRSTTNHVIALEDKVYINNLRIITVDEMNAELTAKNETFEVPYFATRNYNNKTKKYDINEKVYLAADKYYHIGTKAEGSESGSDPYLLLDVTHSTPYFGRNSESLHTMLNSEIANSGGMYIGAEDYTDTFRSYLSFSNNSAYNGLIPVTQEIKDTIAALYDDGMKNAPAEYWSEYGWLQFCVYYKQYGIKQGLSDPIKGLSYFSAFKANETTKVDTYVQVEKGKGQFIKEDGKYIDVEGTNRESEGNYNLNSAINEVHFETIIMPRGYLYEFTPTKSGVYSINGIDCYYYNNDESVVDGEETDAYLFDGDMKVSHAYGDKYLIGASDSDRYERNNMPDSFKIIHYLEAGKTYYINVAFRVVETTGDFAFRIDYLAPEYSYIAQASANLYTLDENSKMVLPLYCDPYYDKTNDVWLDRKGGGTIFVDLTQLSAMFDYYTIEQILDEKTKTAQYTFDISATTFTDDSGNKYDITLDLEKKYGGKDKIPAVLQGLEIKDYTARMKYYLAKSKEGKQVTDEEYGLMPVNNELYGILQLYNAKFFGYDTPDEWLKACCFRMNVKANNPGLQLELPKS